MSFLKKPSYIISRFSQSGWGRLLFTYTRYFDNLPVKKNAMLFEMNFRAFEQAGVSVAGGAAAEQAGVVAENAAFEQAGAAAKGAALEQAEVAESVAFQLLQAALHYSLEHGFRLYVALCSCAENAFALVKQALLEAGFSNEQLEQCVFIKRHSKRYMRVLASAAFLLADEGAFPSFFIRKKEQRLFCVPNENTILKLDRHAVQNCMNFAHMQHVFLQSSFIACSSKKLLEQFAEQAMISQLYKGNYVVLDFSQDAFMEFLCAAQNKPQSAQSLQNEPQNLQESSRSENPKAKFEVISAQAFYNSKQTIALYGDTLRRTGIQSSLRNLLEELDGNKANFVLMHTQSPQRAEYDLAVYDGKDFLNSLPSHISHYGICKGRCMRYSEALAWVLHVKLHKSNAWVQTRLKRVFKREQKRVLAAANFDTLVHFTGYDFEMMHEMICTNAQHKAIFIHSDMGREVQVVKNVDVWSLHQACKNFDVICPVQPTLVQGLANVVPALDSSKIKNVHNCIDNEKITRMSQLPLKQTDYERCSVSFEQLQAMLKNNKPTFLWLGRYTAQKGADRLLEAFDALLESGIEANLIMAGSCGELYSQTCEQAEHIVQKSAPAKSTSVTEKGAPVENMPVAVIYALQNPYALLKRADALVISSLHEGFPMVMLEALVLGKPVVSTDILGVSQFLQENNYGMVVENSIDGIRGGLQDFATLELGKQEAKQEALEQTQELNQADELEQAGNHKQSADYKQSANNKQNSDHKQSIKSTNFAHFDAEKYNEEALKEFYKALGL